MRDIPDELRQLTNIIADWASPAPSANFYLFGSRVRGDHKPESDVDLYVEWIGFDDGAIDWWTNQNADDFKSLKDRLPGPLKILEANDPIGETIKCVGRHDPFFRDRNVDCVCLPPTQSD